VQPAAIVVGVEAERLGIPGRQEILDVDVGDVDLLVPAVHLVEAAVGVFLERVEDRRVVFDPARRERAEHADAGGLEHRDEAAEVRRELLDPGADRQEIIVMADVGQLLLEEELLDAEVVVEARVLAAHVRVHAVVFRQVHEVGAVGRREADAPVDRPERRVAAEQIERRADRRDRHVDAAAAEETLAARTLGADAARHRQVASFEQRVADAGEVKNVRLPRTG
jgi:hypothetical protein